MSRLYQWLPILLLFHLTIWIALPAALEGSIRLDVSEGAIGGREWQLSYLRHPPFTTWAVEIARWAGPLRYVAVYTLGQILALGGVLLCALAARQMEPNDAARKPVFGLTLLFCLTSPVLTYIPIQVSHNIGLMLASGLVILTAWRAFERSKLVDWLIFGVSVGLSFWVKYAIILLLVPLMAVFLVVPEWRRQLAKPGPWLAVFLAVLILLPHAIAVLSGGATTIRFATRTVSPGFLSNLIFAAGFILNAVLFMLPMALITLWLGGGVGQVCQNIAASFRRPSQNRADIFRHAITFGPVLLTALAALLMGVKPRLLWLTPMVLPFAIWFSHYALPLRSESAVSKGLKAFAMLAAILALSYVAVRLISPHSNKKPLYPDFDGPALASLAQKHWAANQTSPLRYIVSLGQQRGRQAGGSVAFDLPSPTDTPIHVMEEASLLYSPWIDLAELKRHGALVISPVPMADPISVQGLPITKITALPRPMVRGAIQAEPGIWFGIVAPNR